MEKKPPPFPKYCEWVGDLPAWNTECGNLFDLFEDTPDGMEFHYCPYCGKPIDWSFENEE